VEKVLKKRWTKGEGKGVGRRGGDLRKQKPSFLGKYLHESGCFLVKKRCFSTLLFL